MEISIRGHLLGSKRQGVALSRGPGTFGAGLGGQQRVWFPRNYEYREPKDWGRESLPLRSPGPPFFLQELIVTI